MIRAAVRFVCVVGAGAVLSAAAAAQDAPVEPAPPAGIPIILPEPVEAAFAEIEARMEPGQRWAFTETYSEYDDASVRRYDPRRGPGSEWFAPSSQPGAGADGTDRVVVTGMTDSRSCQLPPDDRTMMFDLNDVALLRTLFGSAIQPIEAPAGEQRYAFQPPASFPGMRDCEARDMGPLLQHLAGELILIEGEPGFTIHMSAPEPFRYRGVRYNAFADTRRYGEITPGGPIAVVSWEQDLRVRNPIGRNHHWRSVTRGDFERVEIEARESEPTAP